MCHEWFNAFFFNVEGIQRLNFQHFKNDTRKNPHLYDHRLRCTRHDFKKSSLLLLNKHLNQSLDAKQKKKITDAAKIYTE